MKFDIEYERNGTSNISLSFEPLQGKRKLKAIDHRKKTDWAYFMKELVDEDYGEAEKIVLVMDNLNTHAGSSLYDTFEPAEAKRILDKLEIHYTPKHGTRHILSSKMSTTVPASARLNGANGIRGLACLIVLITHAASMFFVCSAPPYLYGTGRIGVWLFFVLSAFLLTYKFERTGFSLLSISNYVIGRILRIIPLFVISVVVYRLLGTAGIDTWSAALDAILFRKAFSHLWTIPIEFKFYVWLPFIVFFSIYLREKFGILGTITFFLFSLIVQQSIWPYWKTPEHAIESYWYFPCFSWGVLLAIFLRDLERHITKNTANLFCFLVFVGLAMASPGARHVIFSVPFDTILKDKFLFIGLAWAIFIACSINGKGWAGYLVRTRFLRKLGHWSYSIYLFHWIASPRLFL